MRQKQSFFPVWDTQGLSNKTCLLVGHKCLSIRYCDLWDSAFPKKSIFTYKFCDFFFFLRSLVVLLWNAHLLVIELRNCRTCPWLELTSHLDCKFRTGEQLIAWNICWWWQIWHTIYTFHLSKKQIPATDKKKYKSS